MPNWCTVPRFRRRAIEGLAKRGPTPFEAAMFKTADRLKTQREREKKAAAETSSESV